MLDPVTALGLAGNIVQVLTLTATIVSETHDFLNSTTDALPTNTSRARLVEDIKKLCKEITDVEQPSTSYENPDEGISGITIAEQPLTRCEVNAKNAATQCAAEAAKLLQDLDALKVKPHSKKLVTGIRAVGKSLRTASKQSSLENQQKRVQAREAQLGTALLQLILERQDARFKELQLWIKANNAQNDDRVLFHGPRIEESINREQRKTVELNRKADSILRSLAFPEMDVRRYTISESHHKTFEWSYNAKSSPLQNWLEHGDGIFWICGKAGSGKSTLMRFLSNDHRTKTALHVWSGECRLVCAQHYFWYAGSPMQKSYQGMLQSILRQILSASKKWDVVSILCADRLGHDTRDVPSLWTREELVKALQSLAKCNTIKVCIFIDGLDEYHPQDKHDQLVKELQQLAQIPNLKLCVSSRPWNIFCDAFGSFDNQIRLEDLTKPDIARYVEDELQVAMPLANRFPTISSLSKADKRHIARLVTDKANGVFLWVYLVVVALKERLSTGSGLNQLVQCLEAFPKKLSDYFRESICGRINETWQNENAQALKLALSITGSVEAADGTGVCDENWRYPSYLTSFLPFWLLLQSVNTPESMIEMDVTHVTSVELEKMIFMTTRHLNACCKDLLCVIRHPLGPEFRPENQINSTSVTFLHRTVFDYLCQEEMTLMIDSYVPKQFQDKLFLLHVAMASIKVMPPSSKDACFNFVDTVLAALPSNPPVQSSPSYSAYRTALAEIDRVGARWVEAACTSKVCGTSSPNEIHRCAGLIRQLAACQLYSYAKAVEKKGEADWVEYCMK